MCDAATWAFYKPECGRRLQRIPEEYEVATFAMGFCLQKMYHHGETTTVPSFEIRLFCSQMNEYGRTTYTNALNHGLKETGCPIPPVLTEHLASREVATKKRKKLVSSSPPAQTEPEKPVEKTYNLRRTPLRTMAAKDLNKPQTCSSTNSNNPHKPKPENAGPPQQAVRKNPIVPFKFKPTNSKVPAVQTGPLQSKPGLNSTTHSSDGNADKPLNCIKLAAKPPIATKTKKTKNAKTKQRGSLDNWLSSASKDADPVLSPLNPPSTPFNPPHAPAEPPRRKRKRHQQSLSPMEVGSSPPLPETQESQSPGLTGGMSQMATQPTQTFSSSNPAKSSKLRTYHVDLTEDTQLTPDDCNEIMDEHHFKPAKTPKLAETSKPIETSKPSSAPPRKKGKVGPAFRSEILNEMYYGAKKRE
ncbi:MAG: hypothetical protein M1831_000751 [Alyxoria varia]|nr:MAG: hypothetical protein M1831_000751 [Alyxoria varia]